MHIRKLKCFVWRSLACLLIDFWKVILLLIFVPAHAQMIAGLTPETHGGDRLPLYDLSEMMPLLSDLSTSNQNYRVPERAVFPPQRINIKEENKKRTKKVRLEKNQGILSLLVNNGVDRTDAHQVVKALSEYMNVSTVPAGKEFELTSGSTGKLNKVALSIDFASRLELSRVGKTYAAHQLESPIDTRKYYVKGEISSSLYQSGKRAGLSNSVLTKLNEIFSYSVDFQRQVRAGDQFSVYYDTLRDSQTGREKLNRILFAELILSGEKLILYRFSGAGLNGTDYFYPDGQSSRGFLMRTPLENARLSSYFGRRKHPVLGYTRMHKGLDFGAPLGTPILAAGDGVIERASFFGSFGNYVRIRHNSGIKTIYAHLKGYAKGINRGVQVKQGQVIGYLGATGRVQGRHLHYEIHKNGRAVDPLRIDLPVNKGLQGDSLDRFFQQVQKIQNEIAAYGQSTSSDS